tara:strand:- start:101 stop:634 length:534 start_codon:yes stop_codon:yes gene_type:complete
MKFFIGEWYSDLAILECYMRTIKAKTGTNRLKKFKIKNSVGYSVTYGFVKFGYMSKTKSRKFCEENGMYESVLLTERPELLEVFSEFRDIYFKDFDFNSIQLNYNYALGPHRDRGNCGESVLVACGDYCGGATVVELEDRDVLFDARDKPIRFDGSKHIHYVNSFEGDRFSMVFYKY